MDEMRKCYKCGETKPSEAFNFANKEKGTRQRMCRACYGEYNRLRYQANREAIIAATGAYAKANPEKVRERAARWREKNRAKYNAYLREWNRNHPDSSRVACRNRYAKKKDAGGMHTRADVIELFAKQDGRCVYCGADLVGKKYEVDHVMPIALGGSNGPENLAIACPTCNRKKSAKSPEDWFADMEEKRF